MLVAMLQHVFDPPPDALAVPWRYLLELAAAAPMPRKGRERGCRRDGWRRRRHVVRRQRETDLSGLRLHGYEEGHGDTGDAVISGYSNLVNTGG
jgi:hypothetical protein